MNKYSIVIAVYNSQDIIATTIERIHKVLSQENLRFEVILINDGSDDNSWQVISEIAINYPEVTSINLLKNYGQHSANLCGFRQSSGDYVITMDDDLQNPPEEIPKLIKCIHGGYDLVIGNFITKQHSFSRRLGSKVVGWLNRKVFDIDDKLVLSNFRIIKRNVIDRVCRDNSYTPYIPGLLLKYSSDRINVEVKHEPRSIGVSNYTSSKLLRLVGSILFNHSSIPLRFTAVFGFIITMLSFALSIFYFIDALINGSSIPGWSSLAVMISFFSGFLILLLSIIGEYMIRLLREFSTYSSYEVKEIIQ
jgi:glycosyltransferase involved in cell wall biosynthesis